MEVKEEIRNIICELSQEANPCKSIGISKDVCSWGNKENIKTRSQPKETEKQLTVGLLVL